MEVRQMSPIVLLLEAVSECLMAYCAQARVLQTLEVLLECCGLWCWIDLVRARCFDVSVNL